MGQPESHLNVVSTVTLVLDEFITQLEIELPKTNYVYDENLSYETAIAKLRSDNSLSENEAPVDPLPLFIFRRSVLRHVEKGAGRRVITNRVIHKISDKESFVYTAVHGILDIEFIYVLKDVVELERFEIAYLSEKGFSEAKELLVDVPDFEPVIYRAIYDEPLGEKIFNSVDNYYKALTGTFTIEGMYLLLEGKSKHITKLKAKAKEFNNKVLIDRDILPKVEE